MNNSFPIVVLADGDYPSHPIPLGILHRAQRLYCCDHAGATAMEHGLHPTAIIGDGDSLSAEEKARFGSLYHHVAEQDYNDLTKTLRFILTETPPPHGSRLPIAFLGATGKREDHTLGNIALMRWYFRNFPVAPTLFTDHGCFRAATGSTEFESFPGQQVSIFNFGCSRLENEGLKWPSYAYAEPWQGTLNEATSHRFTLSGDGDYLVFLTY